ncbi:MULTISPECIES: Hint domain-containing protein [Pseudomonas]|uniref:Hint domain-containing protein n=1 Tax=Pseudomonas TaxID=286 RepID=UPI00087D9740|nr:MULTISPECIES: Hint domain-containing protein [Pseudomonas]MCT9825448.1 hypothetical protein [Pseudomonas veronii]SDU50332.1 intein N-terminal splicing region [Pseudomonas yamanorum]
MQTTQPPAAIDRFGRVIALLTADEHSVFQNVLQDVAATKRGVLTLDMRKSDHRRFVLDRLGGDDYLERYFPATRNLVESTRVAHEALGGPATQTLLEMDDPTVGEWQPLVNITYFGVDTDGSTVIAQGIVTLPDLACTMSLNLVLTDNITGQPFASITLPTQYNVSTQTIEATGTIPAQDNVNISATLTASYLPAGATTSLQVVASAAILGAVAVSSVNVINPNHNNHPTASYIKVALNRTPQQQTDCDYYYNYGMSGPQPIVGLQVNGSAQLISGFSVAGNPNFNGTCLLIRRSGTGDGATLAFPEDQIPGLCNGAGNAISWNIGPDWFNGAPWDQGQVIDLNFVLNFTINPGGQTFVRVTSAPPALPSLPTNIATIAPMQFVWGCVAVGTPVRMADGTLRAIETLKIGERVADGAGASLRIAEVWNGHEAKPLYRLTTAGGGEVWVTEEHPVPTTEGVWLARELTAGMRVSTAWGEEPILAVELVEYDGPVVNLDLLPDAAQTLLDVADDAITAFEAGGILVGDNRMQRVWSLRAGDLARQADPLLGLGHAWQLDITNSQRVMAGLSPIEARST